MFKNKSFKYLIISIVIIFSGSLIVSCGGGSGGPSVSVPDSIPVSSIPPIPNPDTTPPPDSTPTPTPTPTPEPTPSPTSTPDSTPTPTPTSTPTPTPTPSPPAGHTRIYAVLVGIADYPGIEADLNWTVKDVNDFESALKDCSLWEGATIVKLTDYRATKANIRSALMTAAGYIMQNELVVFLYSGHGTHDESDTGYLVCYDGVEDGYAVADGCISSDELESWLSDIPFTVSKFVVIDSCFSGLMIDRKIRDIGKIKYIPMKNSKPEFKGNFNKSLSSLSNLVCITASAGDEVSYESSFLQNGVLVHYVVKGLGLSSIIGPADENNNDLISAEETYIYAAPKVTSYISDQHPQIYDSFFGELTVKQ